MEKKITLPTPADQLDSNYSFDRTKFSMPKEIYRNLSPNEQSELQGLDIQSSDCYNRDEVYGCTNCKDKNHEPAFCAGGHLLEEIAQYKKSKG